MLGPTVAAWLALSLGQLQWETGLRAEGRALQDAAGDLQLEPHLAVESLSRDLALRARYDGQVILRTPSSRGTDALNGASLFAALRVDPDTSLTASQTASVGTTDFSWLALPASAAPALNVQGIVGPTIAILNESSTVTLRENLTRRLSASVTGAFGVTGALYDRDLAALPRTKIAQVGVASTWTGLRDTFSLGGDGSLGWVSNGYTTSFLSASAGWRHAFSVASRSGLGAGVTAQRDPTLGPLYESELRAGVAVLGGNDPAQPHQVFPTAAFNLLREPPAGPLSLGAKVSLRYAPQIDPVTGLYLQRGELSSAFELRLLRDLLAYLQGGVGMTPDPPPAYPQTLAQAAWGLTYQVVREVAVSAGVRVAHLPETEWAGVVSATLTQRGRF